MMLGKPQMWGVLLIWIIVELGPTVAAVGAGSEGGDVELLLVWTFFLSSIISPFILPLSGRCPI